MALCVEVLNTGTELLLGSVINTHLKFFADALFPLGLRIARQVTVPDGQAIGDALRDTFGRADIVLLTGGLGPTTDDVTREMTAELLGLELVHDEKIMVAIAERFARRGVALNERVRRQAQRPREATVLPNAHGTAPGLYLPAMPERKSPHLFLLPGPPRELQPMFNNSVAPLLRNLHPSGPGDLMRIYRVTALGESAVEELVGPDLLALGLELGYCARPGEVDVRLIGPPELLARGGEIVSSKLAAYVVSNDAATIEKVIVDLLNERRQTLTTAESCTGGFLVNRVTNVAGASRVLLAGFVTYSNEAKARDLGVDVSLFRQYGAVSREVAAAMAKGALRIAEADYALSTTGIAGPNGGTPEKPVGTVYIALASKRTTTKVQRHKFVTDRETFKLLVSQTALDLLRRTLAPSPSTQP